MFLKEEINLGKLKSSGCIICIGIRLMYIVCRSSIDSSKTTDVVTQVKGHVPTTSVHIKAIVTFDISHLFCQISVWKWQECITECQNGFRSWSEKSIWSEYSSLETVRMIIHILSCSLYNPFFAFAILEYFYKTTWSRHEYKKTVECNGCRR